MPLLSFNLYGEIFDNLAIKEYETIKNLFSRVVGIINRIKSYSDTIQDKKIIEKILRSLTTKFDHIPAIIEDSKYLSIRNFFKISIRSGKNHAINRKRQQNVTLYCKRLVNQRARLTYASSAF